MPCYDPRGSVSTRTVYESGISPLDLEQEKNKRKWMESALCSIFSELERRDIAESVIAEASRNGLIGIMDFWSKHKNNDVSRLAKALHNYSKDEQDVLRKLLNK